MIDFDLVFNIFLFFVLCMHLLTTEIQAQFWQYAIVLGPIKQTLYFKRSHCRGPEGVLLDCIVSNSEVVLI